MGRPELRGVQLMTSFVVATPELITDAAARLAAIGSTIREAHAAAALPTTTIAAPGADEVSEAVSTIFVDRAWLIQAAGNQAVAFNDQFTQLVAASSTAYQDAEQANTNIWAGYDADFGDQAGHNAVSTPLTEWTS
jgi:PE family